MQRAQLQRMAAVYAGMFVALVEDHVQEHNRKHHGHAYLEYRIADVRGHQRAGDVADNGRNRKFYSALDVEQAFAQEGECGREVL